MKAKFARDVEDAIIDLLAKHKGLDVNHMLGMLVINNSYGTQWHVYVEDDEAVVGSPSPWMIETHVPLSDPNSLQIIEALVLSKFDNEDAKERWAKRFNAINLSQR